MSEKPKVYYVTSSENGTATSKLNELKSTFKEIAFVQRQPGITEQIRLKLLGKDTFTIIWDSEDTTKDHHLVQQLTNPNLTKVYTTHELPLENADELSKAKVTLVTLDELINQKLLGT